MENQDEIASTIVQKQKDEKEDNENITERKEKLTCRGIPELHSSISMPARSREAGRGNDQCALFGAFMSWRF